MSKPPPAPKSPPRAPAKPKSRLAMLGELAVKKLDQHVAASKVLRTRKKAWGSK